MDGHNQVEPVCKFGPGGDFVSFWPCEPGDVQAPTEPISVRKANIRYPVKSGSDICSQALLFSDDGWVKLRTGHKPKARIRAYRRIANKRPTLNPVGQGSLFEADFKGAKTA